MIYMILVYFFYPIFLSWRRVCRFYNSSQNQTLKFKLFSIDKTYFKKKSDSQQIEKKKFKMMGVKINFIFFKRPSAA